MIRIILTFIITLFTFALSLAQETHTISIEFTGMKSNKGTLLVGVYNTEKSFLKERCKSAFLKISDNKATTTFNVPAGIYAISAFHDENDNKKMDTNFFKIPKEAIGTSNDARGMFGPPKFKDAKFTVNKDVSLKINVATVF